MTPFVQPLDAGIIRCFKAHYHALFCKRALELDMIGEDEIFKIDIHKAMLVTVSPSPQSKIKENKKLHELRRYARDFRRQHTTDTERFNWDLDDEDYGLAIGRLVVT
jgi:hypothetical protein